MVENKRIQSFNDFREVMHRYRSSSWVFRGVPNIEFKLIPKIGRPPLHGKREVNIFQTFCRGAVAFINLPSSKLECLAIAQHHGLPTRLLDWTENPLVAAYFAVASSPERDGAVYMLKANKRIDETDKSIDPFDMSDIMKYYPQHVTSRITSQRSMFTIHPNPTSALNLSDELPVRVHRVVVPKEFKNKLRHDLSRYHVHRVSLFPDLGGLAEHLVWTYSNVDPYEDDKA